MGAKKTGAELGGCFSFENGKLGLKWEWEQGKWEHEKWVQGIWEQGIWEQGKMGGEQGGCFLKRSNATCFLVLGTLAVTGRRAGRGGGGAREKFRSGEKKLKPKKLKTKQIRTFTLKSVKRILHPREDKGEACGFQLWDTAGGGEVS